MKKEKKVSNADLRQHYDLTKLEVVRLGPGWSSPGSEKRKSGVDDTVRYYESQLAPASPLFSVSPVDKKLLTDFFMVFARTEYALKKAKYVKGRRGQPEILWDEFARRIGDSLFASNEPAVTRAIKHLIEKPPRRQVVKDDKLTWEGRTSNNQADLSVFLIRSITTVRNNLFHGGKQIKGLLAERDRRLLESCLNLLSFAISLDADVWYFFQELPREIEVA
ncbi:MAG TPA: hypothetical protein VN643_17475 [Pyrinomonadaceae bacterium]|nr:hypothetical protein [Pyrinomonadaceae bacterium]